MRVRTIRGMCVAVAGVVLSATMVTGAGASSLASGNAHAISLYTNAVKATNALPVLRDTSTDTFYLSDNIKTLTSYSTFAWLIKGVLPKAPAGFVHAKSVTTYHLVRGFVSWTTTLILPDCGSSANCKNSVGLEFYDTPSQEKLVILTGSRAKYCWAQTLSISQATFAFTPHSGVWRTLGKYSPIRKVGRQTLFTAAYSSGGYPITETDYLSNATNHFNKSVYHYAATGQSKADIISLVETDPTTVPAAPNFPSCKN